MKKGVAVIGAGAWGTSFSTLLANNGFQVKLWCFEKEVVEDIKHKGENSKYLPGFKLDKKIKPTNDLQEALRDVKWVFEVVPVKFMRSVLESAKPYVDSSQVWVLLSKGIEQKTLFLPSDIINDVFPCFVQKVTIGGPNFAKDFACESYTATTVACKDYNLGFEIQKMLANSYLRPYLSLDLMGVQVGGAIKNVLALTVGIFRGAGYKDNTIAFLLTRGLVEMVEIARYFGGQRQTIYGLSGLGDLVLSSFGSVGRNQKVGMMIGKGDNVDNILKTTGFVPEGINTIQSVRQLIDRGKLDLPICRGVYEIIFDGKKINSLLDELMERPLTKEYTF
jgi:glycerol-3-phosphate dehydrogenase (NAD(P)+)